jgi:hypothetical protein
MTAPLPPTDGPVSSQERLAAEDHGTPMGIIADHPDLSGITDQAVSLGEAWNAGAAQWADSPQGDGLGGYTLAGDQPAGADGTWNSDMSFPHQGP